MLYQLSYASVTYSIVSPSEAPAKRLERETGIEPATNSLEGCDSTIELLPPWKTKDLFILGNQS